MSDALLSKCDDCGDEFPPSQMQPCDECGKMMCCECWDENDGLCMGCEDELWDGHEE